MAKDYGNLGIVYQTRGDISKACFFWQECLKLFTEIGAKGNIAKVQNLIDKYCPAASSKEP